MSRRSPQGADGVWARAAHKWETPHLIEGARKGISPEAREAAL